MLSFALIFVTNFFLSKIIYEIVNTKTKSTLPKDIPWKISFPSIPNPKYLVLFGSYDSYQFH